MRQGAARRPLDPHHGDEARPSARPHVRAWLRPARDSLFKPRCYAHGAPAGTRSGEGRART